MACDFCCALAFPIQWGLCQRRQFDYLRPESNKTRILYYGAESGIMVYGGVFRSISNHKMYLGRITEANECADGGVARQLLYFYALKSVPLAPISHYQSYECKICRVYYASRVFVCVWALKRSRIYFIMCSHGMFFIFEKEEEARSSIRMPTWAV